MTKALKAPFPYFGGKSRVASIVWDRFGDVKGYVEGFTGSAAVLLARPHWPFQGPRRNETANDISGHVTNFWRSIQRLPDVAAYWAEYPTSELDLHARGDAMFYKGMTGHDGVFRTPREFVEKLRGDMDWCDPKLAGIWVWGASNWIGDNWGTKRQYEVGDEGSGRRCLPNLHHDQGIQRRIPGLSSGGMGIARQLPRLDDTGTGVARKGLPAISHGTGVARKLPCVSSNRGVASVTQPVSECDRHLAALESWFGELSSRLRHVRLCCGDWKRVCSPAVLGAGLPCGIFLDPPYDTRKGLCRVYSDHSDDVSAEVREWAIENGQNPQYRICLCGYDTEHVMPPDWEAVSWKSAGGYGNTGKKGSRGRQNASREMLWFSPACRAQSMGVWELTTPWLERDARTMAGRFST